MRFPRSLAKLVLYISTPLIFIILILARPPISYYTLPLAPIALAALLYEFIGGTLAGVASMIGVSLLIALDPDAARRGMELQTVWPLLLSYLALGPAMGWLTSRLFALDQERMHQLEAISVASQEISAALDLERTLRLVMAKAVETLPMDAGALFRFEKESQTYRVTVSHNLSQAHVNQITFAFNEGVPGWVVKHQRGLIIPDARKDSRVHPFVMEDSVLSVLALPMIAREQVVGVLNLYSKSQTNAFDQEALRLAQVYADQAAVALENARLVEELRQAATDLEKRVEQRTRQLRESQAQTIRAEKLAVVGRLATSVAHEVNNPLQAITLQLQLIDEQPLPEEMHKRLGIVQQEVNRITGIVQRLLDFQRPSLSRRTPQQIATLLDEVISLVENKLYQHHITVRQWKTPNLPLVIVDGGQIKQVFLNLILNAIDAMSEGGTLSIRSRHQGNLLIISFTDSGVGMLPEVIENIFEPFFSTKASGSGLGLTISQKIVINHGGTLEVTSTPGKGSTFTVLLPIEQTEFPIEIVNLF
jgi:signal transduction histidine kinase